MSRPTTACRILGGIAVAAIALSAFTGGALAIGLPEAPTTSVDEAVAPTPTDAPAGTDAPVVTEPATDPAPNPVVPDDSDLLQGFLGLLLVAIAAIAVVAVIARARQSRPAPHSASRTPQRTNPSAQSSLLSTSQWINDQLALELMAATPEAALPRWSVERSRLDNVAIGAQQEYLRTGAASWQVLGQSMSSLAMALDTSLRLRSQPAPDAALVAESVNVVNRQRAELRQITAALAPTIER